MLSCFFQPPCDRDSRRCVRAWNRRNSSQTRLIGYACQRDREASAYLRASLDKMTKPVQLNSLIAKPILIPRRNKFPVVLRIRPFKEPTQSPEQEVHTLVTVTARRPDHLAGSRRR